MHTATLLSTVFAASAAYAQVQVAAAGSVHTVTVGGAVPQAGSTPLPKLQYTPESINAAVGDTVQFVFMQENHTATQSAFDAPCVKLDGGKDSGFMPNPEGKAGVTWDFKVNVKDPIWFYCAQTEGAHCGHGMVFSINAETTGTSTFADFKQLAIQQNGTKAEAGADALKNSGGIVGGGGAKAKGQKGTVTMDAGGALATGTGVAADGSQCQCECLCQPNTLPQQAGIGGFGGFAGQLPAGSA